MRAHLCGMTIKPESPWPWTGRDSNGFFRFSSIRDDMCDIGVAPGLAVQQPQVLAPNDVAALGGSTASLP